MFLSIEVLEAASRSLLKGATCGVRIITDYLNWTVQLYVSFVHFDSLWKSQKRNNIFKMLWAAPWAQLLKYSFRATIPCFVFIRIWHGRLTCSQTLGKPEPYPRDHKALTLEEHILFPLVQNNKEVVEESEGDKDLYLLYLKVDKNLQESYV